MSRLALGALLAVVAAGAHAQSVPGRDLLGHGLGLTAEGAALAEGAGAGFWNPATAFLPPDMRGRVGAAALNAPIDLSFSAQIVHLAMSFSSLGTVSASVSHAAVSDLIRTDTDPQSIGSDIAYRTIVVSAGLARRLRPHVVGGAAIRWHWGEADQESGNALATDVGVVFDQLTKYDGRIALSTFLVGPGADDAPALTAAADARVAHGPDTAWAVRAGYGFASTRDATTEHYPYVEARYDRLSVRGGPVFVSGYGNSQQRLRLGVNLRQNGFTVGIAREDNAGGLNPTYHLSVVRTW